MGQGQSNETNPELTPDEIEKAKVIQDKVDREGPDAIVQYIRANVANWKKEAVNIGVSGRYKTGTSTFINAVLQLQPGQEGTAKSGSGNTTLRIESYKHPTNPQIILYDFPGVGTPEVPRETYMNKVKSSKCDYFLIFFDAVISEDDLWLAGNLSTMKTPFCFVRSMIDQDIENAKYDGKDSSKVPAEIREKATTTMSQHDMIENSSLFLISGRHTNIGDFDKLLDHMGKKLPPLKCDAIVLAREVIEKKYTKLKERIRIVSLGAAAISTIPIPFIDRAINISLILNEIKLYINTFGFDKYKVEDFPLEIKEKLILKSILAGRIPVEEFITAQLGKLVAFQEMQSVANLNLLLPVIGSKISTTTTLIVIYRFLSKLLENFKDDAVTVYDYIIETQARID